MLKHNDALESGCTSADIRPSAWLQRPLLMIKVTDPIGLQGPLAHARTRNSSVVTGLRPTPSTSKLRGTQPTTSCPARLSERLRA